MTGTEPGPVRNEISDGTFYGPVIQAGHVEASFLPAPAPVALAQLPPSAAGFTGRGHELAVLAGLLAPATDTATAVVVSAVAGLAGVGKTALAVAAGHAARNSGWYPGGVLFIDLHGYDDRPVQPAQALDALLRALGIPGEHIPPGTEERAALYRSALAESTGPVLIIADNASSEAQVRPLVPGEGLHRVLVTSRHTLAGLGARLIDITVLGPDAAVALLDTALRAARPADDRITADPDAAARLAEACGGLPLALAITAAILTADPTLTAADLASELGADQDRLALLAYDDGSAAAAPSVTAAFELSYRRLDDTPARLLRILAIHPGPDASTASAAVLAGLPAGEARRLLAALARAHLAEPALVAAGRWRMHDLVRLYARQLSDQHAAEDGRDHAITMLLGWYLDMTDAADDHLRALPDRPLPAQFADREDALAWLDAERPALTAAVALAAGTGHDQAAMTLPLLLSEYLSWRRRFDDWITVATASLAAARRLGDEPGEASALISVGASLLQLRRFDEAITASQDAAGFYRSTGDQHSEAVALNNLGIALQGARRFDEAITACQDAAIIYRDTGERHAEAIALDNLGVALAEVRRFDEAITAHQDAAIIYRSTDDQHGEAVALNNLGIALQGATRFDEAITACQDAAAIYRDTGDRHGEGMALNNLGLALHGVSRFDEAITAHQDAASIYRETGDQHREGSALNNLGLALVQVRRFDEAITACQDAAAIYRDTGDRHGEGAALNNLGAALFEVRRIDEAITAYQGDIAICQETGDRNGEAIALSNLGEALREAGRSRNLAPRPRHPAQPDQRRRLASGIGHAGQHPPAPGSGTVMGSSMIANTERLWSCPQGASTPASSGAAAPALTHTWPARQRPLLLTSLVTLGLLEALQRGVLAVGVASLAERGGGVPVGSGGLAGEVARNRDPLLYEQALQAVGLTQPQMEVLTILISSPGPVRPAALAAKLMLERSTVSRNLALMQKRGWVAQAETSATGRAMSVTITDAEKPRIPARARHGAAHKRRRRRCPARTLPRRSTSGLAWMRHSRPAGAIRRF